MAERRTLMYVLGAALVGLTAGCLVAWFAITGDDRSGATAIRQEPVGMGTSVDLGNGWSVTVNSADTDADAEVAAAEEFNEPPAGGKRYVVVNLSATNVGDRPDTPEVEASLFGSSGVEHDGGNLVTPPEPRFDTVAELEPGGSTEGNLVFIADVDETDLLLRLQPLIEVGGNRAWVALEG
jgi:hypothetical protein